MVGWMAGSKAGPLRWNPPTDGRDGVDAGEAVGVPDDVDDPGVYAAGTDHQAVAGDVEEPIYLKLLRSWKVL